MKPFFHFALCLSLLFCFADFAAQAGPSRWQRQHQRHLRQIRKHRAELRATRVQAMGGELGRHRQTHRRKPGQHGLFERLW